MGAGIGGMVSEVRVWFRANEKEGMVNIAFIINSVINSYYIRYTVIYLIIIVCNCNTTLLLRTYEGYVRTLCPWYLYVFFSCIFCL